jgi:prophage regulatory protein
MQPNPSQPPTAALVPDALLKVQTVTALTGLAGTTLRRLVATGKFPAPVNVAQRCTRWRAGAVTAWLQAQCR